MKKIKLFSIVAAFVAAFTSLLVTQAMITVILSRLQNQKRMFAISRHQVAT